MAHPIPTSPKKARKAPSNATRPLSAERPPALYVVKELLLKRGSILPQERNEVIRFLESKTKRERKRFMDSLTQREINRIALLLLPDAQRRVSFSRDTLLMHHQIRILPGGENKKGDPIGKARVWPKIRTMVRGADEMRAEVLGEEQTGGVKHTMGKDPREIPILGPLLRRTRGDETPQISLYRQGELQLFGIRPPMRTEYRRWPRDIKQIYNRRGAGLWNFWTILDKKNVTDAKELEKRRFDEIRRYDRLCREAEERGEDTKSIERQYLLRAMGRMFKK